MAEVHEFSGRGAFAGARLELAVDIGETANVRLLYHRFNLSAQGAGVGRGICRGYPEGIAEAAIKIADGVVQALDCRGALTIRWLA